MGLDAAALARGAGQSAPQEIRTKGHRQRVHETKEEEGSIFVRESTPESVSNVLREERERLGAGAPKVGVGPEARASATDLDAPKARYTSGSMRGAKRSAPPPKELLKPNRPAEEQPEGWLPSDTYALDAFGS